MNNIQRPFAIVFDTETTGLFQKGHIPRLVQLAWQAYDSQGTLLYAKDVLVKPDGFEIPFNATKIHGISTEQATEFGKPLAEVLTEFRTDLEAAQIPVGHNLSYDRDVLKPEFDKTFSSEETNPFDEFWYVDTMTPQSAEVTGIETAKGFKLPKLSELYSALFNEGFDLAHNAAADVAATSRCFFQLIAQQAYTAELLKVSEEDYAKIQASIPNPVPFIEVNTTDYASLRAEQSTTQSNAPIELTEIRDVVHLHTYSQFSVLESPTKISKKKADSPLLVKVKEHHMSAIALTDKNNLMGSFKFLDETKKFNKANPDTPIKPIIGCELHVCRDHTDKANKDNGYPIIFLAKNRHGFRNLSWLSSHANIDGFYYLPRIDKELVLKYKEDLIVLSGGIWGIISHKLMEEGEKAALEEARWWKEHFGDDFYIELNNHNLDEDYLNPKLNHIAQELHIKCVATSLAYYLEPEDSETHDILLCIKNGQNISTPIGNGRRDRKALPNNSFYLCSKEEMNRRFIQYPEALDHTLEIADKIDTFELSRDVVLPEFDIPQQFQDPKDKEDNGKRGENAYLRHLTYVGAHKHYGETLSEDITERLDFELEVIAKTGYPGYFLIVQDFIAEARNMGVYVGPGRGSAAGSAVAYCTGITNIDPIQYGLLFERFLNPERISMPDIDIDFDDEGRDRIIEWVMEKYGANNVAQIITYGFIANKSAIRDTGRVLELPLNETNQIAKNFPDSISLDDLVNKSKEELLEAKAINAEQTGYLDMVKDIMNSNPLARQTLDKAKLVEGNLRNLGIHACGLIITPTDIRELSPVTKAKDAKLLLTQFDNSVVEDAGLLKMDFLGLKTLSIIKEAVRLIKKRTGEELDPELVPLDDAKTFDLFKEGQTVAVFQYESAGMQKHLKDLKPDVFEDLIAMNALYRPGPLQYIPNFIKRKHGEEEVIYDIPAMEGHLKETYGITVYQEQVMLLSQELAGFTKGQADLLRKGMGKKVAAILDDLKPKFIVGGVANGHPQDKLEKVWKDWEAFAAYAFNKSHSTCYAFVAFQTAYLKANYPAEFMAANLSKNMSKIEEVAKLMNECRQMGIDILPPDVNKSDVRFSVEDANTIRFGLAGIKNVSRGAVEELIEQRNKDGHFANIFDLSSRLSSKSANKKNFENLIFAGAMDTFGVERAAYFLNQSKDIPLIEEALKFSKQNQSSSQNTGAISLFGEEDMKMTIPKVEIYNHGDWSITYTLEKEKEVIGLYISQHPLDAYAAICTALKPVTKEDYQTHLDSKQLGKQFTMLGILTSVQVLTSKKGNPYGKYTLTARDFSYDFFLFGTDFVKFSPDMNLSAPTALKFAIEQDNFRKDADGNLLINPKIVEVLPLDHFYHKFDCLKFSVALNQIGEPVVNFFKTHHSNMGKPYQLIVQKDDTQEIVDTEHKLNVHPEMFAKLSEEYTVDLQVMKKDLYIGLQKKSF